MAETDRTLGINSLGRIGKLSLWHHVERKYFGRIVANVGRPVGRDLEAVCQTIEKDSTYGSMHRFLYGVNAEPCIRIADRAAALLDVAGTPVRILQEARNPSDIGWRDHGARVVVDCTGAFDDPTRPADDARGALRGHLAAGAEKVLNSAAFKIKDTKPMPDDAITLIYGINHDAFDPTRHHVISAASCTTTGLAHMVKPLLDHLPESVMVTASMSTVHAVTNSQSLLDAVPKSDARDLRRTRSALNSLILTSSNASAALEMVIPEIREIGFMGDAVRVPLATESLIILNLTFQSSIEKDGGSSVDRELLNDIYRQAASGSQKGLLVFSEEQNVAADVVGMKAAVVIEGSETHSRTGFLDVDLGQVPELGPKLREQLASTRIRLPVTHAKVFGWYDNEYGSYTNLLGDLTVHVHRSCS
jgi:glyceraldehyde 3-phosphate dehydrogenase